MRAVRLDDPDAARPGAEHPARAVHLHAVREARFVAAEIGEDAAADIIAFASISMAWTYRFERVLAMYRVRSSGDRARPLGYSTRHDSGNAVVRRTRAPAHTPSSPSGPGTSRSAKGRRIDGSVKVDTAVAVANDVVRPVEAPALETVDKRRDRAVQLSARDVPRFPSQWISRPSDRRSCRCRRSSCGSSPVPRRAASGKACRPDIIEIVKSVRMPQRSLGEDETGGLAHRVGGVEDMGKIVHGHAFRVAGGKRRQDRRWAVFLENPLSRICIAHKAICNMAPTDAGRRR